MDLNQYLAIMTRANAAISFAASGDTDKANEQYGKLLEFVASLVTQ